MIKERVGVVTKNEKDEIQGLFNRRSALQELFKICEGNDELYEKVLQDTIETQKMFSEWWSNTALKYCWKSNENGNWEINFETNEIYLVY